MWLYKLLHIIVHPIMRFLYRFETVGKENLPENACVICANHTSNLDVIFVALALPRNCPPRFMGKAEIFKIPVLSWFLRSLKAIPVNRGAVDISTLRDAIDSLKNGESIMIFPEGTRRKEATRDGAKTGAAMIACRAKAPMLPVYVSPKKKLFRKVRVIIGNPVETESIEGTGSAKYQNVIDEVFGQIISLGRGEENA